MRKGYYEFIKEDIAQARIESQDLDRNVQYIPDFFKLLCDLLDESTLMQQHRTLINCAISYLVVPNDVMPEEIYGIRGYMDDLFVVALVVKQLYKEMPELVKKHWNNTVDSEDFESLLESSFTEGSRICDEENMTDEVLRFSGLKDTI